jgi:hypothetical protein
LKLLLDTSAVSTLFHAERNEPLETLLIRTGPDNAYVSVVTIGELDFGIRILPVGKRRLGLSRWFDRLCQDFAGRFLPIDKPTILLWSSMRAQARSQGTSIADFDGLIAATAIRHGLTVVTRNARDFAPTGASILDPWA